MTKQDEELLLKDLSARIYYGVIVHVESHDGGADHSFDNNLIGIQSKCAIVPRENGVITHFPILLGGSVKPYLRSMSSMTEKEIEIYHKKNQTDRLGVMGVPIRHHLYRTQECIDWLIKNHFDFRGLIGKRLAIKVTPDNNPYKRKRK